MYARQINNRFTHFLFSKVVFKSVIFLFIYLASQRYFFLQRRSRKTSIVHWIGTMSQGNLFSLSSIVRKPIKCRRSGSKGKTKVKPVRLWECSTLDDFLFNRTFKTLKKSWKTRFYFNLIASRMVPISLFTMFFFNKKLSDFIKTHLFSSALLIFHLHESIITMQNESVSFIINKIQMTLKSEIVK